MKRRDWIELRREPERGASRTLAALCPGEPPARPITATGRRPGLLARRGDRAGRRPLRSGVGARLRHRDRASRSRSSCARTGGGAHRSTRIRAARLDDRHQSQLVRGGPGRCDRDRHAAVATGRHHPATCCCAGPLGTPLALPPSPRRPNPDRRRWRENPSPRPVSDPHHLEDTPAKLAVPSKL